VNYAAEIKQKLQFETQNIPKYFADNFYTFEKDIRELIKKRWKTGKKPNGGIIGVYRSIDYALFKKQKSDAPFRVVDLTLTGRLGDGIQVELFNAQKGIFEVFSTDIKFESIVKKYGADNFNLTEIETEKIINEVTGLVYETIIKKVYGK